METVKLKDYETLDEQKRRLRQLIFILRSALQKLEYIESNWYHLSNKGRKLSYVQLRLRKSGLKIADFRDSIRQKQNPYKDE